MSNRQETLHSTGSFSSENTFFQTENDKNNSFQPSKTSSILQKPKRSLFMSEKAKTLPYNQQDTFASLKKRQSFQAK